MGMMLTFASGKVNYELYQGSSSKQVQEEFSARTHSTADPLSIYQLTTPTLDERLQKNQIKFYALKTTGPHRPMNWEMVVGPTTGYAPNGPENLGLVFVGDASFLNSCSLSVLTEALPPDECLFLRFKKETIFYVPQNGLQNQKLILRHFTNVDMVLNV